MPEQPNDPDSTPPQPSGITADASEAGLKLIALLERRLGLPKSLLHRWIRTGQVRLNGARPQPFARVSSGDQVRLPPFAFALAEQASKAAARKGGAAPQPARAASKANAANVPSPARQAALARQNRSPTPQPSPEANPSLARQITVVGELDDLLCVLKPAGLPTHPGSGHADSLVARLAQLSPNAVFPPTPVHRLDRDTSGLLLVATTFASLRQTQELLKTRSGIVKEYLAWVEGDWPWQEDRLLRHFLAARRGKGMEKMAAVGPDEGREASLIARPLARCAGATLLQIRLLTGRKHQIRVQLAAEGHPIVGDVKYGAFRGVSPALRLRLHAFRIVLAGRAEFTRLPSWEAPWEIRELPPPIEADREAWQPAAGAGS